MTVFARRLRYLGRKRARERKSAVRERKRENVMRKKMRVVQTILSAAAGVMLLVPIASACGTPATLQGPFVLQQLRLDTQNPMESLSSARLVRDLSKASTTGSASIVALWNVQFLSKGNTTHNPSIPDAAVLDFEFTQW